MSGTGDAVSYEYVVLRCVPRVDREEFVNVGMVLHCRTRDFLGAAWHVDRDRLVALAPTLPADRVLETLAFVDAVCAGDPRSGAVADQPLSQRFGFLRAPRSTVLQPGPVHGGTTTDPAAALTTLLARLVH